MKHSSIRKLLALLGSFVLIAALALTFCGCGRNGKTETKAFQVVVTDLNGQETTFHYTSDAQSVGEALLAEGLIQGEQGEYGLYVKTVNGLTLDWEKDGKFWAFYIDGEFAATGVDQTPITDGSTYGFKPE